MKRVKYIVENEKLLMLNNLSQCFQMSSAVKVSKYICIWERIKGVKYFEPFHRTDDIDDL